MEHERPTRRKKNVYKILMSIVALSSVFIIGLIIFTRLERQPMDNNNYDDKVLSFESTTSLSNPEAQGGELVLNYLGEVHIESYEGYFRVERLKNGFDEANFSFWYTYAPVTSDNPNNPLVSISGYHIDTETEMVIVAVNRKLDSLVVDEDSKYDGMMELDESGNKIPQPPFLSATFAPTYYPNTLFLYRAPLIRFRSHYTASPDLYNEWNRIAE